MQKLLVKLIDSYTLVLSLVNMLGYVAFAVYFCVFYLYLLLKEWKIYCLFIFTIFLKYYFNVYYILSYLWLLFGQISMIL